MPNRYHAQFNLPKEELDGLCQSLRLEERKEIKRFLQKRVSKSVSDYTYRYEEQRRMMNLRELGSIEELVAKILDWITEQTQYKGTVRSGPRTAALKDADSPDDVSPSVGAVSAPTYDDEDNDEEDCDEYTVNAMPKGNLGYTGSTRGGKKSSKDG